MKKHLMRAFVGALLFGPPAVVIFLVVTGRLRISPVARISHLVAMTARGDVDSLVVVQWCFVAIVATWFWIIASVGLSIRDLRTGRSARSRFGRWLALMIATGAIPAQHIDAQALPTHSNQAVLVDLQELQSDDARVDPSSSWSDVGVFGLGAGSALVGAGMAKRIRRKVSMRLRAASSGRDISVDSSSLIEWPQWRTAERLMDRMQQAIGTAMLNDESAQVVQVIVRENGDLLFEFDRIPKVAPPFERLSNRILSLPVTSELPDEVPTSCVMPVLLHVGRSLGGSIWVNLTTARRFSIEGDGDEGDLVWRAMTTGLRLSPYSEAVSIIGSETESLVGSGRCAASELVGSIATRASVVGDVVAILEEPVLVSPGSEVMVMRRGLVASTEHGLVRRANGWRLLPSDTAIDPVGLSGDEVQAVRLLLGDDPGPIRIGRPEISNCVTSSHPALPKWTFLASVMGPPRVMYRNLDAVDFERSKAEELVIWLALHPQQRRRSLARTALWNAAVKDATFSN
ncbi:MAG: hypothetical protein RL391_842, partial [Actinomycetota bacterium]